MPFVGVAVSPSEKSKWVEEWQWPEFDLLTEDGGKLLAENSEELNQER